MHATPAVPERTAPLAPVELDVVVPCDPGRAFDCFTRDIGRWRPLATLPAPRRMRRASPSSRGRADVSSRPHATAPSITGAR